MTQRDWRPFAGRTLTVDHDGKETTGEVVSAGPRTLWIHTAADEDVFINYDKIGAFSEL